MRREAQRKRCRIYGGGFQIVMIEAEQPFTARMFYSMIHI
jgi:hypothetical protein